MAVLIQAAHKLHATSFGLQAANLGEGMQIYKDLGIYRLAVEVQKLSEMINEYI
ncbi:MAG: hypothetical protein GF375_04215 [Candidatus Omnitrophica bacterium]|nr:hypothetical protein [Candidatus Omnitrophota bacterium]MBD3269250.1 hypothetical protein [Candidatus Omnitrophota bacterium]